MPSPSKEDLPKVSTQFKIELRKFDAGKMKRADTKEKNPLPSKEDVIQEKQRHELFTGVNKFNKSKLKRTNTKEKIVLPTKEVLTQEKAYDGKQKVLQSLTGFDRSKLRKTKTVVKNLLPTKEEIDQEKRGKGCNSINNGTEPYIPAEKDHKLNTSSCPSKEDLPKVSKEFKIELEVFDATKMKRTDTKEKNPLPSKEDVIQEKQRHELFTGVNKFNKAKLKRTNTKEKIVLPTKEVLTQEKVYDGKHKVLQSLTGFDRSKLRKTKTVVKNVLPTKEEIEQEKRSKGCGTTLPYESAKPTGTQNSVLTQEKVYDGKHKVLQSLAGFDRSKLRKTKTVVKNVLPTKEEIEQEKRSKGCGAILQGNDSYNSPMSKPTHERNHSPTEKDPEIITLPSPSIEDLPRVSKEFKIELEIYDAAKMKHADTKEKNPLPSKEDIIQEKQRHELFTGVNKFNKAKLKRTNTREKIVLPTKEVLTQEKVYDGKHKVLQSLAGFDRSKLRKTKTVVKNVLPTKEEIEQEKRRGGA